MGSAVSKKRISITKEFQLKTQEGASLKPILKYFAACYIACTVGIAVIAFVLEVYDIVELPSGVTSTLPMLLSVMLASQLFVRTFQREVTAPERQYLAKYSLLLSVLISIVYIVVAFGGLFAIGLIDETDMHELTSLLFPIEPIVLTIVISVLLLVLGLNYLIAWFLYGSFTGSFVRQMRK